MSPQSLAAYSFLPWARQGLGTHINESDLDGGTAIRGSFDVTLGLNVDRIDGGAAPPPILHTVGLYGPGDIIGIDPKVIIRTEPRHWITNFETNYMPFVEFYDEDFPWRYTPAKPSSDGKRLRPWLTLAVLEADTEFQEGGNLQGRPLPFITIANPGQVLPPADQLWAWAHVHVNGALAGDPDNAAVMATGLTTTLQQDQDLAYSRLLSPRILKPNTGYHAFLIPTFETGRLAGLGKNPGGSPSRTQSAWEVYSGREEPLLFPFYHRWYFRTGDVGDFESLVRLLQPKKVDPQVGRRDMDVQVPDANLPAIMNLGGILRLGGALRAPLSTLSSDGLAEYRRFEAWGSPYPHPFQTGLAALVNLAADYSEQTPTSANAGTHIAGVEDDEDPMIVPPLYGRWHAQTSRLTGADGDPSRERWVQEMNLDPRHRVTAGIGTSVVQTNQEAYMEAAWQQVGTVLEGNRRIRYGYMAKAASKVWHAREMTALQARAPEQFLAIAAPVQSRILLKGLTVRERIKTSTLPNALTSKVMRQALRPRGRISRRVGFTPRHSRANLLDRVNREQVSAAPPKTVSATLPTEEKLSEKLRPWFLPHGLQQALERFTWLRYLLLLLALLPVLILRGFGASTAAIAAVGTALAALAVYLIRRLVPALRQARAADALHSDGLTPDSVRRLPASPNFAVGSPKSVPVPVLGSTDSPEAVRYKESLRGLYAIDEAERAIDIPVRAGLDLPFIAVAALQSLQPGITITNRIFAAIQIPDRIRAQMADTFGEVMVYPVIDLPMYEPLYHASSELFLPNVQKIENNSITLVETNRKFIEAYMVGLNHEFSRELLWREFPTDQRGSYFRQFWDVRGFLPAAGVDPETLRERLYDITKLHRWGTDTGLGKHNNRQAESAQEEDAVMVVRGELLKKYPTAVIYAHRAAWERTGGGAIDKTKPRKLAPLSTAEESNPPRTLVKTPLYEAKVDPDIYFFGFDLTVGQARGGQIVAGEEDPGWFFVIKERPGEPRFGLDIPQASPQATFHTWNDLAWTDVMTTYTPGAFLQPGQRTVALTDPGSTSEAKPQYDDDRRFQWRADTQAAELAYILFQTPVLMAVHATELLKDTE
ncbi:MAG: hypothetical protein WBM17_01280 [Anaerolineales bacterium]